MWSGPFSYDGHSSPAEGAPQACAVSLLWLAGWLPSGRQHGSVCSRNRPGPHLLVSRLIMVYLSETNALLCCLSLSFLFSISSKNISFPLQNIYSPAAHVAAHRLKHIKAGGAADLPSFRRICLCFELARFATSLEVSAETGGQQPHGCLWSFLLLVARSLQLL